MGLNVASVKSYVSSALTTTLFGSGVGEREVGKLTSIIMNKMLFAQGWQFSVEVDGLEGADFFAKDITYHDYSIEYETIKIGGGNILQPTERSPGQITMMVRDTVDGLVLDWFKTAKSRVINPDGTGNIPSKYLLNVRIYRLLSSGLTKLENEMTVFPVTTGDVTYARDQVTEFKSFPMTFALHSTFNQSSSSLTDPDGSVYMIKAKSIQGVDMADAIGKLFKAYKAGNVSEYLVQPEEHKPENVEPEPAEDTGSSSPEPEVSVGAYRYALQMRPAAPGAIPEGNKAILPRPDEGDPYYEYARYGIATYDTPLSDQQMSEYDLKLLPREDSFDFLAKTLTNGPFGKYAQKALELATSSPDEFRVMLKTQFQKTFPNIAFPGGAGTEKMVQSMINALQAEVGEITQPEPAPAQPDETVSEADAEANKAIEYLNNVMDMQSTDMAEIRNARGNVREAIAALQAAGRFEENEELVNGAARHLADLLVAIQKAGVAA